MPGGEGPRRAAGRRGLRPLVGGLRPGPDIDIDEYLGPGLAGELAELDFADWTPYGETHVHPVGANWKVTLDTYRENYHFPYLHKDDAQRVRLRRGAHVRPVRSAPAQLVGAALDRHAAGRARRGVGRCVRAHQPPVLAVPEHLHDLRQPPHRAVADRAGGGRPVRGDPHRVPRPDLSDEELAKLVEMAPWICETVVDGEDFWVAGRTEPGLSTGLVETVVFGRNEPAPQHLHKAFLATIDAAER